MDFSNAGVFVLQSDNLVHINLDSKTVQRVSGCLINVDTCHECLAANDPECYWKDGKCGSDIGIHHYDECGALAEQTILVPAADHDSYLLQIRSDNKPIAVSYEWHVNGIEQPDWATRDRFYNLYIPQNQINDIDAASLTLSYPNLKQESFWYNITTMPNLDWDMKIQQETLNSVSKLIKHVLNPVHKFKICLLVFLIFSFAST